MPPESGSSTLFDSFPSHRLSTRALLTSDNATQHLYHFCSLLGAGPYIDPRPQFQFHDSEDGSVQAEVTLPISIDSTIRHARSARSWRTERMAKNDAAFQAYQVLHKAGLVNDHLLPHTQEVDDQNAEYQKKDQRPSLAEASPTLDPWGAVAAYHQQPGNTYYKTLIIIQAPGETPLEMVMLTACPLPLVQDFVLHWNALKQYTVKTSSLPEVVLDKSELLDVKLFTWRLLQTIFHGRMDGDNADFLWLFVPGELSNPTLESPQACK